MYISPMSFTPAFKGYAAYYLNSLNQKDVNIEEFSEEESLPDEESCSDIPDCFRDSELFNDETDYVTPSYKMYDYDDLPVYSPELNMIVKRTKLDFDTTILVKNTNKKSRKEYDNAIIEAKKRQKDAASNPDSLLNACYVNGIFSQRVYDMLDKIQNDESLPEQTVIKIANLSKLKRNDGKEYFNIRMINPAKYCVKKYPKHADKIMKKMILVDSDGNENFSLKAFNYLKKSEINQGKIALAVLRAGIYEKSSGEHFSEYFANSMLDKLK